MLYQNSKNSTMSLDREEPSVNISKKRLSELETKANAANDFIQHFQNIDKELRKEKAKVKKFTKMLIDDQKVIGRLTSGRCISATDLSSIDTRSLYYIQQSLAIPQSIIETDGSSGSSFSFFASDPFSSPIPSAAMEDKQTKKSYSHRNILQEQHFQTISISNLNIPHVTDAESHFNGSMQYKRSASMHISMNSSKGNRNVFSDVVDDRGVSEMVFLNLVKELKRTKQCLNELMLEKGISLEEFMRGKVDKAALEDMASCIEDLKKENENYQNKISELNNSLCFYKNLVKTEKEGLTMQFDCRRPTHNKSLEFQKSLEETDKLKVENCQLKEQLMKLEEEKNVILDNYAKCIQTVSELEDHLNEDQLKKKNDILKKESEKLEREIANLQNDNEKLMSSSSRFTDMLKQEKGKNTKLEAELKEGKMKQQNHEQEILLLKAKCKHLLKQVEVQSGKTKSLKPQDKLQAPVKPTKITKPSSPVESSSSFIESELIASSSLTGVKTKNLQHVKKLAAFECDRCQAQFEDEMEHLCHINKCLD